MLEYIYVRSLLQNTDIFRHIFQRKLDILNISKIIIVFGLKKTIHYSQYNTIPIQNNIQYNTIFLYYVKVTQITIENTINSTYQIKHNIDNNKNITINNIYFHILYIIHSTNKSVMHQQYLNYICVKKHTELILKYISKYSSFFQ